MNMMPKRVLPAVMLLLAAGCGHNHEMHRDKAPTVYADVTGPQAKVTMHNKPLALEGTGLSVGDKAPDVSLVTTRLSRVNISDFRGKVVILSVSPSLDTPVCNNQTLEFDYIGHGLIHDGRVATLSVSRDLPFALDRWEKKHKTSHIDLLSDYDGGEFGRAYGVLMAKRKLLARSVFVIDPDGRLVHVQVVGEQTQEPNYEDAVRAAQKARK